MDEPRPLAERVPGFDQLPPEKQKMLDLIDRGASPENAAVTARVKAEWQADEIFNRMVEQMNSTRKVAIEIIYYNYLISGKAKGAELKHFLASQAGWDEENGGANAQNITIIEEVVDGREEPPEENAHQA